MVCFDFVIYCVFFIFDIVVWFGVVGFIDVGIKCSVDYLVIVWFIVIVM